MTLVGKVFEKGSIGKHVAARDVATLDFATLGSATRVVAKSVAAENVIAIVMSAVNDFTCCLLDAFMNQSECSKKIENLPEKDLLEAVFQNCKNPKMSNQVFVCYF